MIAFYIYLGLTALMGAYALYWGIKDRDIQSFLVMILSVGMLIGIAILKAFNLYSILIGFFMLSGLLLIAASDLGLMFMNPTPFKEQIKEFPTYTVFAGVIALLSATELWIEYNSHWGWFQLIFGTLMTIAFITCFIRALRWSKSGIMLLLTIFFAAAIYVTSRMNYFDISRAFNYWIVSVFIQTILFAIWRGAVKLEIVRHPLTHR
ncbi:hypothetical protein IKN40_02490 [bacterium]|nr:hypothetical protein [bacterium]